MNLNAFDDGLTTCKATHNGTSQETASQPVFSPVNNPDLIGRLHHFSYVPSKFINPRNIQVWLPPDYGVDAGDRYAVLYMHDGQNLFEPKKSFIGVDWGMDEAMAKLCGEPSILSTIVVGIWNTPQRLREYLPQKPFCGHHSQRSNKRVVKRYGGSPISDNYLRFLVYELKPFIDCNYRTRPQREFTFVMGSSMGGLISLYAICEYPQVFGGVGSLSTHWPILHRPFSDYLKAQLPEPGHHKIYLDYGNEAISHEYRFSQKRVEQILKDRGYALERDWLSKWYAGAPHSETAWRTRVRVPLQFLLKDNPE